MTRKCPMIVKAPRSQDSKRARMSRGKMRSLLRGRGKLCLDNVPLQESLRHTTQIREGRSLTRQVRLPSLRKMSRKIRTKAGRRRSSSTLTIR